MGTSYAPEIYCVKCKARTGSRDIQVVTLKNGSPATRAFCGACSTQKFRMGPRGLTGLVWLTHLPRLLPQTESRLSVMGLGYGSCKGALEEASAPPTVVESAAV